MKVLGSKKSGLLQPTRRKVLTGMAAAGAAGLLPRPSRAAGKVIVGTWGGDYQNLLQEHVAAPILAPENINVVYDFGNDLPRHYSR